MTKFLPMNKSAGVRLASGTA